MSSQAVASDGLSTLESWFHSVREPISPMLLLLGALRSVGFPKWARPRLCLWHLLSAAAGEIMKLVMLYNIRTAWHLVRSTC